MIVSVNRPYFAPYPGFFYKIHRSDVFVILDTVQFPRGTTWLSRNRFKNDKGVLWITVPVWKKGLGLQQIDQVEICYDFFNVRKHLASLKSAYGRSPFFQDHLGLIEEIFTGKYDRLLDLNMRVILYVKEFLQLDTRIISLSGLGIHSRGDELLIEICKKLGSARFLAQRAALKYLDSDRFRQNGIRIEPFTPPSPIYPQLWGEFIPNLSMLDLLFNCGPKAREVLLSDKD